MLVLATKKAGAENEESIEEISMLKHCMPALEPVDTRNTRVHTQQLDVRTNIDRTNKKIEGFET